jgi:hypothetical protein
MGSLPAHARYLGTGARSHTSHENETGTVWSILLDSAHTIFMPVYPAVRVNNISSHVTDNKLSLSLYGSTAHWTLAAFSVS